MARTSWSPSQRDQVSKQRRGGRGRPLRSFPIAAACLVFSIVAIGPHALAAPDCGPWQIVPTPDVGSGNRSLGGVVALSPSDVFSMGLSGAGAYLLHWNGSDWSEVDYPELPEGTISFGVGSIGTDGEGRLWAAGVVADNPFYSSQFLMRRNGGVWDRTEEMDLAPQSVWPFNPRNGMVADLDGVWPDDVWAVGTSGGFGDGGLVNVAMILHWDGSTWIEMIPPPVSDYRHFLLGVSATAADDVWAVGEARNLIGPYFALLYHWNGSEWSDVPNPARQLEDSHLRDVVALASDDVWVTGNQGTRPIILHWDGSEWSFVDHPLPQPMSLGPITAIAPDDIWTVARSGVYPPTVTFLHWDGSEWSAVAAPAVEEADGGMNLLGGIAAAGPCDVWSVGSYSSGGWVNPLAMHLAPGSPAGVEDPEVSVALRAWPDPFRVGTTIAYALAHAGPVRLSVYDTAGRYVRSLRDGWTPAGAHAESWAGDDALGRPVPPGVYFARLVGPSGARSIRLVRVR